MKHIEWFAAATFMLLAAGSTWQAMTPVADAVAASEASLATQTSREGGVTVEVTPKNLAPGASSWDFEIVLNTHTQPLDQDLLAVARLVDSQGRPQAPLAWKGSSPGGHHRRGLLLFRPLPGDPTAVELRLYGIGGVETRAFRWQLR